MNEYFALTVRKDLFNRNHVTKVEKGSFAARSDWSKTHVIRVENMEKACFITDFARVKLYHKTVEEAYALYYTVIKHSRHLRTLV